MEFTFNKYWIIVSILTIANIFIFIFLSKNLEKKVIDDMVQNQTYLIET